MSSTVFHSPPRVAADASSPIDQRVRELLAAADATEAMRLGDVARRLGMAPQTLARHLREAGTSFRQIKHGLRRDRALALLSSGATAAEVSAALGFSEPSAFSRAFKAWTGHRPSWAGAGPRVLR